VPTYEYECQRCRRVWEVRQRISEPALTTCDQCGGPIQRLLSPAPFILKGGGWYVTDYPSESRKKGMSSADGGGEKSSGDKPSGEKAASDTKPASDSKPAGTPAKDGSTDSKS
jgi:putative FmdB family regulatory protein